MDNELGNPFPPPAPGMYDQIAQPLPNSPTLERTRRERERGAKQSEYWAKYEAAKRLG